MLVDASLSLLSRGFNIAITFMIRAHAHAVQWLTLPNITCFFRKALPGLLERAVLDRTD
jgi:hypothetical protein